MSYDILEILVEYLLNLVWSFMHQRAIFYAMIFYLDRIVSCLCMIEILKINNSLEAYDAQQKKIKYLKLWMIYC